MKRGLFSLLFCGAMLLLLCPATAFAAELTDVSYLDEDGVEKTQSATQLTSNDTEWGANDDSGQWYVATGDITIDGRVTVTGDVHLILADGCTLIANGGINVGEGQSLTVYAQSGGTGKLTAESTDYNDAGIGGNYNGSGGNITINGGNITATGGLYNGAGIGSGNYSGAGGTIIINGGSVTATGTGSNGAGIGGKNSIITISGGSVTATGNGGKCAGIGGENSTIIISGGAITATGSDGINGINGTFATGTNGNAFIFASSISDQNNKNEWSGVIFEGNEGVVYGSPTLTADQEIPADKTLTVPAGSTLTVESGATLTINGTLNNQGAITGSGTFTGNKAIPTVTAPETNNLTYNGEPQNLITAGSTTGGELQYSLAENNGYSTDIPTGDNAGTYTVYYKVTGDDHYADVPTAYITVEIAKATPASVSPTDLTATGGQTLAEVSLPAGWAWNNPSDSVGDAGSNTFPATFTPTDTENYKTVTQNLTVTVSQNPGGGDNPGDGDNPGGGDNPGDNLGDNDNPGGGDNPGDGVYTITFDTDGGTMAGAASQNTNNQGELTMPAATKTGYTLKHWQNKANASQTYAANNVYKFTADTNLIAIWENAGGTPSGGGSASGNVSIATKVTGGKVTVTPTRPSRGQTVTVNVTPNEGYTLSSLTVTDNKGNALELTKVSDSKYTFVMPAGKITVTPEFVKTDAPAPAEETKDPAAVKRFSDVASGSWYAEYITYVTENGLMNGYEDGRFGPNDNTTRAQIVTVLYRLVGEPAVRSSNSFSDVSAGGQYYSNAVAWAAINGIINGYEDGRFAPNDNLTREQIAAILYRFAQFSNYDVAAQGDLSSFADADKISGWANEALEWAVGAGLLNGNADGTLNPGGNATRAEVAALLNRFIENFAK